MNGLILYTDGTDFFDIRKNKVEEKYKNVYQKDSEVYFSEYDKKQSKIYDFDSEVYDVVLRKRGSYYYAFLVKKGNQSFAEFVLISNGTIYSTKDFNKFIEEVLLEKFGINYFYLDVINEINKKVFLIKY